MMCDWLIDILTGGKKSEDVTKVPLSEIQTGFIGLCANGRMLYFVRWDTNDIRFRYLTSVRMSDLIPYDYCYDEKGNFTQNSDGFNIVKIFKSIKEKDGILQAELFWERPPVDWSKVPVDTPVLVTDRIEDGWAKRHFAFYKDGYVYTYSDGKTSFTTKSDRDLVAWTYAKLADKENCKWLII